MVEPTSFIWMNGKLVPWADATVHVGTHALHYGSGVFEGIRAYEAERGTAVFRLPEHLDRLVDSATLVGMEIPFTVEELRSAVLELVRENGGGACYVRPLAFFGSGGMGILPAENPVETIVMTWPWATLLGEEGLRNGIRVQTSSWQRVGANTIPHVAKATGIYLNSMLAVREAVRGGYDEAILLTSEGRVADGSGESLFVVKDGVVYTPDLSASILVGITRATVVELAESLGRRVVAKPLIRTDLYLADEVFMTGTAAEVTPIREVDDHVLGPPGPVTLEIQQTYLDTVRGRHEQWAHWLDYVT
jgi:branched-chain amino acid aminotransferase